MTSPMDTGTVVGSFDAKTRLSALLEQVERGEVVTITRRGRPVARLVPATEAEDAERATRAIARLRTLRQGATLGGLDWRELRDAGRR
ncbi:MAG TPA: type II toxin-antitoxin system Phd/YefM family antitoxin [Acetobacteraceae bacterium]|nr:type II toxin-antitoxin system Phd/YefM family antitoxin [Acetobacteraceae bacterium]